MLSNPTTPFARNKPLPPISMQNISETQVTKTETKSLSADAQRVMNVLQDTLYKFKAISFASGLKTADIETFDNEKQSVIKDFQTLQTSFKEIHSTASFEQITDLTKKLQNATHSLNKSFASKASLPASFHRNSNSSNPSLAAFIASFQQLLKITNEQFLTPQQPEEKEKTNHDKLSQIIAIEAKQESEATILQTQLDKIMFERTTEINKRNEIIKRLKDELKEIKTQAEDNSKKLETRSKQKEDYEFQKFSERKVALCKEMNENSELLRELRIKNKEEELNLRRKKCKFEAEIENWIVKYDQEMDEKQTELDTLNGVYSEEKAQLEELQQKFYQLQTLYDEINKEKQREENEKKRKETLTELQNQMAVLIQSTWRGYITRKLIKNPKSGGKKKSAKKSAKKQ